MRPVEGGKAGPLTLLQAGGVLGSWSLTDRVEHTVLL